MRPCKSPSKPNSYSSPWWGMDCNRSEKGQTDRIYPWMCVKYVRECIPPWSSKPGCERPTKTSVNWWTGFFLFVFFIYKCMPERNCRSRRFCLFCSFLEHWRESRVLRTEWELISEEERVMYCWRRGGSYSRGWRGMWSHTQPSHWNAKDFLMLLDGFFRERT